MLYQGKSKKEEINEKDFYLFIVLFLFCFVLFDKNTICSDSNEKNEQVSKDRIKNYINFMWYLYWNRIEICHRINFHKIDYENIDVNNPIDR